MAGAPNPSRRRHRKASLARTAAPAPLPRRASPARHERGPAGLVRLDYFGRLTRTGVPRPAPSRSRGLPDFHYPAPPEAPARAECDGAAGAADARTSSQSAAVRGRQAVRQQPPPSRRSRAVATSCRAPRHADAVAEVEPHQHACHADEAESPPGYGGALNRSSCRLRRTPADQEPRPPNRFPGPC